MLKERAEEWIQANRKLHISCFVYGLGYRSRALSTPHRSDGTHWYGNSKKHTKIKAANAVVIFPWYAEDCSSLKVFGHSHVTKCVGVHI